MCLVYLRLAKNARAMFTHGLGHDLHWRVYILDSHQSPSVECYIVVAHKSLTLLYGFLAGVGRLVYDALQQEIASRPMFKVAERKQMNSPSPPTTRS